MHNLPTVDDFAADTAAPRRLEKVLTCFHMFVPSKDGNLWDFLEAEEPLPGRTFCRCMTSYKGGLLHTQVIVPGATLLLASYTYGCMQSCGHDNVSAKLDRKLARLHMQFESRSAKASKTRPSPWLIPCQLPFGVSFRFHACGQSARSRASPLQISPRGAESHPEPP